jgi:hypothetical protein
LYESSKPIITTLFPLEKPAKVLVPEWAFDELPLLDGVFDDLFLRDGLLNAIFEISLGIVPNTRIIPIITIATKYRKFTSLGADKNIFYQ